MATPDQALVGDATASVELSSSTAPQVVFAGTTGYTPFLVNVVISTDTAQWVKLINDGGGTIISKKYLPANSVWSKTYDLVPRQGYPSQGVKVVCGGSTGNISVDIGYYLG